METIEHQVRLGEMLPILEREHDAESDLQVRDAIWRLITSVEEYLLIKNDQRRTS